MFMKKMVVVLAVSLALLAQSKPGALDFTQTLIGYNGKALVQDDDAKTAVTLGDIAVTALLAISPEDRDLPGVKKFERDQLARKIYGKKGVVLSVEEVALIKDRIGKVYGPLQIGATWPLLDGSLKSPPEPGSPKGENSGAK